MPYFNVEFFTKPALGSQMVTIIQRKQELERYKPINRILLFIRHFIIQFSRLYSDPHSFFPFTSGNNPQRRNDGDYSLKADGFLQLIKNQIPKNYRVFHLQKIAGVGLLTSRLPA